MSVMEKIFSYELRTATKIRTNEKNEHAIWGDEQRQEYARNPEAKETL